MSKTLLNELIYISEKKLTHLKNVCEYTRNQKNDINNDNVDELQNTITKKQVEIDMINKLDIMFNEKYVDLKKKNYITSLDEIDNEFYPQLTSLKNVVSKIDVLLKEVYKLEEENKKNVNKSFDETKRKLKDIRVGKKATNKYNAYKSNNESIFIDSKK